MSVTFFGLNFFGRIVGFGLHDAWIGFSEERNVGIEWSQETFFIARRDSFLRKVMVRV
jgi:hypothetical protein